MSNKKWTITHIHSTPMFYVETQIGRKAWNDFSYMSWRITFIESTNFLCFPDATGRRLQLPSFSGYNLREAPSPQFYGYNYKEATNPYALRLKLEGGYNHMYQNHQLYTSCMFQLINYLSQPCTQHVPQTKSLINLIIQIWFVTL